MTTLLELLDILSSRFIIVFVGEWGSGKTLSMVSYVRLMSEYMNIKNIISNVPLYFPNREIEYSALTGTKQFTELEQNTIICHDELLRDIDSRNSLNPANRFLTSFCTSFRKMKVQEVGTIQYLKMVDVRFDDILQVIIFPKFKHKYHKKVSEDMKIRLQKKDFYVIWNIIDKKENKSYRIELNLYPFINMYDTNFIPEKLAISHEEYLDWVAMSKSMKMRDAIITQNEKMEHLAKRQWTEGLKLLMEKHQNDTI